MTSPARSFGLDRFREERRRDCALLQAQLDLVEARARIADAKARRRLRTRRHILIGVGLDRLVRRGAPGAPEFYAAAVAALEPTDGAVVEAADAILAQPNLSTRTSPDDEAS